MAAENTADVKESKRRRKNQTAEAVAEEETTSTGKGYATPSRRKRDEEEEEGGVVSSVTSPILRFRDYLGDVRAELTKVVWPTREEATRLMTVVLVTLVVASLVLGLIGFIMNLFIEAGLNNPILFVIGLVLALGAALYYMRRDTQKRGY
jgi:preprotein translocase SecE subunit